MLRTPATPRRHPPVRRLALLAALVLALTSITACGSETSADSAPAGLDSVTVAGEVGDAPSVSFADQIPVGPQDTRTLVTGSGPALGADDSVVVNYWLGNGFTQDAAQDSFGAKVPGSLAVVGQDAPQAQTVDQLLGNAAAGLVQEGTTVGSRIASVGTPQEVLGVQDLPDLEIGNLDPVVLIVDLVQQPLSGPDGETIDPVPAWVPGVPFVDGEPAKFTFGKVPRPSSTLQTFARIVGTGPEVEKGDVLVANYLGQVYGGEKPFDESFTADAPVAFPIGLGNVIEGWDQALVGQTVGSRVILAIPSDLGYGKQGSPDAGIEGGDTLYFVVDILAAA